MSTPIAAEVTTAYINTTDVQIMRDDNTCDVRHASVVTTVTLIFLLLSIALVSLTGNFIACIIVYRKSAMRSAINLLLVNMAIADIVLAVVCMPFVMYMILCDYNGNRVLCACVAFIQTGMLSIVSYTLLVISIDRFLIIVHRKDRLCPRSAKLIISSIWCVTLVILFPQILGLFSNDFDFGNLICRRIQVHYSAVYVAYTVASVFIIFVLPVAIMFFTFAAILRTVQRKSKRVHNFPGCALHVSVTQYSSKLGLPIVARSYRCTGDINAKRRSFGTILILFIALFVCWTPYIANVVINSVSQTMYLNCHVTTVILSLGFMKSALYPLVYSVRNVRFREACHMFISNALKLCSVCYNVQSRRINPKFAYTLPETDNRI